MSCWPAAGTSPPRPPGCSAPRPARSCPTRAPRSCSRRWRGGHELAGRLLRAAPADLGRWWLAAACCLAGFGFGALQDFANWLIYSGDHSWRQYLTYNSTSFAWNVAHAIGNVLFCLLFGPALVNALRRFRIRFEVKW